MAHPSATPAGEPDPVVPDEKDWTWTLTRRCEDCGLAAGEVDPLTVGPRAWVAAEEWVQILREHPAVEARPARGVWSPLEYACHVRDVYRVFDDRLQAMLTRTDPAFANWDQDETAVLQRYAEADPEVVAAELEAAAATLLGRSQQLVPAELPRTGRRSNGSLFTVATLLQYFLHDVVHHLWDVTGQQDGAASLVWADEEPPPPSERRRLHPTRVTANLAVADTAAAREFYAGYLGLDVEGFDLGWVVNLQSPDGRAVVQLVSRDASAPVDSAISVHVGDEVEVAYEEAQRRGLEIVHPLTTEPWGVRRFFVRAPDGTVVNVVSHTDD